MSKENQLNATSSRKRIATSFLQLVVSGKVQEAYSNYISEDFRHHNAYFPGDANSLMKG